MKGKSSALEDFSLKSGKQTFKSLNFVEEWKANI